jgi:hypothetical protein
MLIEQKCYGEKREALVALLSGQLAVLKQEAQVQNDCPHLFAGVKCLTVGVMQVILTLCGLVITVTGFSGGNVIKAGTVASGFLVAGIVFILSALPVAVLTLGQIRWVTQDLDDDVRQFIKAVVRRRDAQRARLMVSIVLLVCGLACYMTAVSIAATVSSQVKAAFTPSPSSAP